MKIRKIQFTNHPVLSNLSLDFTDENSRTVNTIILAGENGVGKSVILNTIFDISKISLSKNKRDEKRFIEIEVSDEEYALLRENINVKPYFDTPLNNIIKINIDYSIIETWDQISISYYNTAGTISKAPGALFSSEKNKRILKTLFSDVEINFTPKQITSVTSMNIDTEQGNSIRSSTNLASEIAQLLVDVQTIDALEFSDWARKNSELPIDAKKIDVRMKRFTSAFEYMFPTKKYKTIQTNNGGKDIVFEENGKEMSISDLSSGEKQIVFRGCFLLKDKLSSHGALVLIDEPEISMHPSWQMKILSFFKMLFSEDGEQTSQIIIATHSPFIIHNSKRSNDKVIVLHRSDNGDITVLKEPIYYNWSPEQKVRDAFNLDKLLSKDITTVFVEGITDEKYFAKVMELFDISSPNLIFKWIGFLNEKGNAENTGDSALNQALSFYKGNPQMLVGKVILFYDNDTNKQEESFAKLFVRTMRKNKNNCVYGAGVENLLELPDGFNLNEFYKERIKIDKYGAESILRELDKQKLCDYICNNLEKQNQQEILINLKKEIERILII